MNRSTCALLSILALSAAWLGVNAAGARGESPAPVVSSDKAKQECFAWNIETLVNAYERAGFTNGSWDQPAVRALTEFARDRAKVLQTNEPAAVIIGTNCELAVKAGCRDPMIAYLHTRFYLAQTNSKEVFVAAFSNAATRLEATSYPPIRKLYAWFRLGNQVNDTYGYGTNISPSIQAPGIWRRVAGHLQKVLHDKSTPPEEVYDVSHEYLSKYRGDDKEYAHLYDCMEGSLFTNWPNAAVMWLLKGQVYIKRAWADRGSGYADKVTEEGWNGFSKMLQVADAALERAWELDPHDSRIPTEMLTVELGQGQGRQRMELWFRRAMDLNPDNYDACSRKIYYLEPKWYGSIQDVMAFGWECAESTNWGGRVPLILADAHDKAVHYLDNKLDQTNYWKRPEVWSDIKESYEKFFKLNPGETGRYHNYAKLAYRCERWSDLNRLIPKLGRVNYEYFGGRSEYDKMLRLAREHAGETSPEPDALAFEAYRLTTKLAARINQGFTNVSDFSDLLKACDALLAKHDHKENEVAAQVLLAKAQLHLQVFGDMPKGKELIAQLKQDYPETELGRSADGILDMIEKEEQAKNNRNALTQGARFPEFDEKDITGKQLSLAQKKGKVVLIDFWATWCGPCVAELPNVRKAYEKHHAQGLEIVGVSLDIDRQTLEDFVKRENIAWPQYLDGQGGRNKLALKCGVDSIPTTFLLDADGKIIGKDLRGDALEVAVQEALRNK